MPDNARVRTFVAYHVQRDGACGLLHEATMGFRGLDLDLMQTLICVCQEGSLTRAAQRLNLTQQSVSAQIGRLEHMVGRRLLKRTSQGVEPTQDGEATLFYAREMVGVSDQIRQHFSSTPLVGSVRLGILEGFAATGLPFVLGELRRRQPRLELYAETGSTERLVQRYEAGSLDLVLGGQRQGGGRGNILWRDKLSWVGDFGLVSDVTAPIPLVMMPAPTQLRDVTLGALQNAGRRWTIFFESDNRASIRAAVLAGLGLAVFLNGFMSDEEKPLSIVNKDLLPELPSAEIFLLHRDIELVEMVAHIIRAAVPTLFPMQGLVAF